MDDRGHDDERGPSSCSELGMGRRRSRPHLVPADERPFDGTAPHPSTTSPIPGWHGLAVYAIALSQYPECIHLALSSPGLGTAASPLVGSRANQALFVKVAMPLARGFSAGTLLLYELSQSDAVSAPGDASPAAVHYQTR
jgi:hypothetical protein